MTGVLWAAVAGVAYGVFQAVNRGTLVAMGVLESTFIQLLISSLMLVALVFGLHGAEVGAVPAAAVLYFGLAGLVHFFGGWTLLNRSQKLLGAARTSPLLASVPLFGTVLALVVLREVPSLAAVAGMVTIVAGVYVVQLDRARHQTAVAVTQAGSAPVPRRAWTESLSASRFGLGAALCWSVSPLFIRRGLDAMDAPMVGVTIGLVAATLAYGVLLVVRRRPPWRGVPARAVSWKIVAGVLVGFATWTRWYALSLDPVTVVLSLGLLSVPTVIALAPLLAGKHLENVTRAVVLGSALVVAGALVLVAPGVRSSM
ncbi:MAG: EamA family transporter [Deinococcales bacterium]